MRPAWDRWQAYHTGAGWQSVPEVKIEPDIVYRTVEERALHLDVYHPFGPWTPPQPVLVCIHGGGWRHGNKRDAVLNAEYCRLAAARGMVAIAPNYRLSDVAAFPAAVADLTAALAWIQEHAEALGADPERCALLGCSAGGHLASLLAVSQAASRLPVNVRAVVSICGPQDLVRLAQGAHQEVASLAQMFIGGPPERHPARYHSASPLRHVTPDAPPFLFVHGDGDDMVPIWHSEQMKERLKEFGVYAKLIRVRNGWHHPFQSVVDVPVEPSQTEVDAAIMSFLQAHLAKPVSG